MRVTMALVLVCFGMRPAVGQLCVGNAAFQLSHRQIAANIAVDRLAQRYAGEFRAGSHRIFVGIEFGVKAWSDANIAGESNAYGVTLGLDLRRARSTRFALCPFFAFTGVSGPDQVATPGGGIYKYTNKTFTGTISAGYLVLRKPLWDFMPMASLSVGIDNPMLKARSGLTLTSYGGFCCGRQTLVAVRLGVGLGFSDSFTVQPGLTLPLSNAGEQTFGLLLALRLGKGV